MEIVNKIKKSIAVLSLVSFIGIGLSSCEKDSEKLVLSPQNSLVLSIEEPTDNLLELTKENLEDKQLKIKWNKADFGVSVATYYFLKIQAKNGQDDLSEEMTISNENDGSASISYKDISNVLLDKMKFSAGQTFNVNISLIAKPHRVSVSDSDNDIMIESKPITFSVNIPDNVTLVPPGFNFVGDMFNGGKSWDINFHGYKFFRNKASDTEQQYIGKFKENSEFKIVPEKDFDGWNHLIGMKDDKLTWDGGDTNIKAIKKEGYYHIIFNPEAFTISIESYDISGKPVFDKISLIGTSVGGWDQANDVLLEKANYDEHIWYKENITLNEGELKIRANQDWSNNWAPEESLLYGMGKPGGANFNISSDIAGKYNVYFCDINGWYIFEKVK